MIKAKEPKIRPTSCVLVCEYSQVMLSLHAALSDQFSRVGKTMKHREVLIALLYFISLYTSQSKPDRQQEDNTQINSFDIGKKMWLCYFTFSISISSCTRKLIDFKRSHRGKNILIFSSIFDFGFINCVSFYNIWKYLELH